TIAEYAGLDLELPEEIAEDDLRVVAELAYIIRTGQSRMRVEQVTLELERKILEELREHTGSPLGLGQNFEAQVFGAKVAWQLAGTIEDWRIVEESPASDDRITVRIEPASEAARNPIF